MTDYIKTKTLYINQSINILLFVLKNYGYWEAFGAGNFRRLNDLLIPNLLQKQLWLIQLVLIYVRNKYTNTHVRSFPENFDAVHVGLSGREVKYFDFSSKKVVIQLTSKRSLDVVSALAKARNDFLPKISNVDLAKNRYELEIIKGRVLKLAWSSIIMRSGLPALLESIALFRNPYHQESTVYLDEIYKKFDQRCQTHKTTNSASFNRLKDVIEKCFAWLHQRKCSRDIFLLFSHGDLGFSNIIVLDTGKCVSIDFETMNFRPALFDVFTVYLYMCSHLRTPPSIGAWLAANNHLVKLACKNNNDLYYYSVLFQLVFLVQKFQDLQVADRLCKASDVIARFQIEIGTNDRYIVH
jgi:thiamine kinase-like enzyme